MAMTPLERQRMEKLEKLVESLVAVQNVQFIKNIERRVAIIGITSGTSGSAATINESVRNAADDGSESVAKNYDAKLPITLSDGSTKYIGIYNS